MHKEESKINYKDKIQGIMSRRSSRRRFVDKIVSVLAILCVILAIVPLVSILIEVVRNGVAALSINFLTQTPGAIGSGLGGIGPAIQGTLIVVGLATAIGVPIGVLAGIYLSEFAGNGIFPSSVRFFSDVLVGLPSIVIGIVGYVVFVLTIGSFSVLAGAFALSIIMIPIVVRVTEETLRIVPNSLREAGYSLGISKRKVVSYIVLKSAKSGVITGIMLAISRIAGETAPLIMTILGTDLFFTSLKGPVDALPLRIWRLASQPYQYAHDFGWGAALILIIIVVGLSFGLRLLSYKRGFKIRTIAAG
ncbi:MAG TPA: phosphate ABC transporter permease PstA [Nitrososphaeraceae archaeon]|nr:phosphate ABC transporter permease PstA [Nitrososphaeraceae archaeon]